MLEKFGTFFFSEIYFGEASGVRFHLGSFLNVQG